MAYTDVNYEKVSWLNTPSTNTPINATNLGKMDDGIEACANRANASVPFDNILSLTEAQSTSVTGTYVLDAVDSAKIATRIGNNTITYENGDYYIQNENAIIKKKLLSSGLWYIGYADGESTTLVVPEYLKDKVSQSSFYFVPKYNYISSDGYPESIKTITPSVQYNSQNGYAIITGLHYYDYIDHSYYQQILYISLMAAVYVFV